ncbi:MAG TPA: hypothetical protein VM074_00660 [Solimonas sp.]|nr:hypothetical protein [Solimonas sp.]
MHLVLLLLTLAALSCGPLLYAAARRRPDLARLLDRFVLVAVAGLVLVEVLPPLIRAGGWTGIAFLLLGLLGPTAVERLLSRARREAHIAALVLAFVGLVVHSLGDGAALSPGVDGQARLALGLAVALHSIPVGLLVWWLIAPAFGVRVAAGALLAMCASTVIGYRFGIPLSELLGVRGWEWFQALVAGTILHVAFGRPHLHDHGGHAAD